MDKPWSEVLVQAGRRRRSHARPAVEKDCLVCGKKFLTKCDATLCSVECANFNLRKVERPSRQELEELVSQEVPWSHLGLKYGVAAISVKKWARKYGIKFEPRWKLWAPNSGNA
jgi:hypothetical protein